MQYANISLISVTFEVSNPVTSIDLRLAQSQNIPPISVMFDVSRPVVLTEVRLRQY